MQDRSKSSRPPLTGYSLRGKQLWLIKVEGVKTNRQKYATFKIISLRKTKHILKAFLLLLKSEEINRKYTTKEDNWEIQMLC